MIKHLLFKRISLIRYLAFTPCLLISLNTYSQSDTVSVRSSYRARDFRTWSFGANGGVLTQHTLLWSNKSNDYRTPTERFGYGFFIKKQIVPSFGLQGNFHAGQVKALRASTPQGLNVNSSYTTNIEWSGSLTANYTFVNFKMMDEFGLFGPYLSSGLGYMYFDHNPVNSGNSTTNMKHNFFIPVGLGLKIGLSRGINLDMGYTMNFMKTDRFDGYDYGNTYDKFSYTYLGLEFAIGNRKKYQLAAYNPSAARGAAYDDTELKKAIARLDSLQKEDRARYNRELGDEDNDGVANKFDKCPGTPAGTKVDGSGCPLTAFAQRVVKEAYDNLEFEFGKSTILPSSYPTLDSLAKLLSDNDYSLKISGHTDHTGSDRFNLKLSKDRAEAVKSYLTSKGVKPSNIEATGYGEFQPIAPNSTAEGRRKNRRVEFTLY